MPYMQVCQQCLKNKLVRSKVLIIAEAGVNHNGSLQLAKQLIDAAVHAGADIVKFQTFKAKNLVSKNAQKAEYQKTNTGNNDSQLAMLQKLELSYNDHVELINYCQQKGIEFWSTAFDNESIDLLVQLGMQRWKVPSGEITNLPYLKKIAAFNQPIIISTGMCFMQEINDAVAVLEKYGTAKSNITVLHCNTEYPTPMQDVNLLAMLHIKQHTGLPIGYSDHTLGIEVPVAAVALGATVIEKHFTLDKTMEGPDHIASLNPAELKQMVAAIRNIEQALGGSNKQPSASEIKNINIARKSIVAATKIAQGETFTEQNLTTKRPGNGISPMQWQNIIGTIAHKNFEADELITTP